MTTDIRVGPCKRCRFWERRIQVPAAYGICTLGSLRNGDTAPGALAFARDTEELRAELITAPDFGCVQFQLEPALVQITIDRELVAGSVV